MESQKRINPVIMVIHDQLWISIIVGFMRYWLSVEIQKRINSVIRDIHNSIMDIHNSIMDIHNHRVYAHGKPKAHKPYNYGYP